MKNTLAIAVASSAFLVMGVAHADAAPMHKASGCVTKAEYKKAKKGWSEAKVHHTWGTSGKRMAHASSGGYTTEVRTYDVCRSPYSVVSASFSKNPGGSMRLDAKTAVWVG